MATATYKQLSVALKEDVYKERTRESFTHVCENKSPLCSFSERDAFVMSAFDVHVKRFYRMNGLVTELGPQCARSTRGAPHLQIKASFQGVPSVNTVSTFCPAVPRFGRDFATRLFWSENKSPDFIVS